MLKESATGIRVQSCEGDKITVKEKKRKRRVKEKIREKENKNWGELVDRNI